jgi:predicted 3-demethylubiquinone-9 3-methyltransferase (glyoxalase superfamily)
MFVRCEDQREVDHLWTKLMAGGGKEDRCGWMRDRFGLSWQICPVRLLELLTHRDRAIASRAQAAMMTMQKIDIAALERAVSDT